MVFTTLGVVALLLLAHLLNVTGAVRDAVNAFGGIYFALIAIVALMVTRSRRGARKAWANINQVYAGTPTSRRNPSVCYSGVIAGQPYLIGGVQAVALDTAASVANGTPTFELGGAFSLSVTAKSSLSPSTNKAINPGDPIYYEGGTLDTASNMTYGGTLDANSSGVLFGHLDPTGPGIPTGTTVVATVMLDKGL